MAQISSDISTKVHGEQIPQLNLGDDMVMPNYGGLSLVNIPCTVSRLLAAPDFGKPALDPMILDSLGGPYQKVVLLLVDALGTHLLDPLLESGKDNVWGRYVDRAVYAPITSICPSTTASALTTLWTGEGPAAHGIIGYEMWAKEYGMVMNNILHSAASSRGDSGGLSRSGFDPHDFIPVPRFGSHLFKYGVRSTAFMHSSIVNSGLSLMQLDDVNVEAYVDEADLWVSLVDYLAGRKGIREYVYVYYSHVDSLMHRFSAQDLRVSLQFEAFSSILDRAFLHRLPKDIAKDTLLILLADHGSMTTPKKEKYALRHHPGLLDNLVMQPTCENRLAFFFVKPGKFDVVRDYIHKTWPDEFYVLDSGLALESGLFGEGPFHPNARERLGDLIAVARGNAYFWWAPKPNHMAGRHGGLSPEEMLVPFYALPLSEI